MPVLARNPVDLERVRDHYDRLSWFYDRFWGAHIHHGYWTGTESIAEAQRNLIEQLASCAKVQRGAHVLDVGCGLGGSSFWLAQNLDCTVLGITLSAAQVETAERRARRLGLVDRVSFTQADANTLEVAKESYDAVWTIECSEHLFDKSAFFAMTAAALRPGGVIALCAWLGQPKNRQQEETVAGICDAMVTPSLGSMADHLDWLRSAGLEVFHARDVTAHVAQTWKRAGVILQRPEVQSLLAVAGPAVTSFCDAFLGMREAYATGAMAYGMFAARKPA